MRAPFSCALLLQVEVPRSLVGGATALVLDGWAGQGSQRGFGPGTVDLLRHARRLGAERGRSGDLVPVTVSSDHHSAASPLLPPPLIGWDRTECCDPWLLGVEGGVEDSFYSGFDEVTARSGPAACRGSWSRWLRESVRR